MVVRAKIQNGVFVPIEPLPPEWREGAEVDVINSESAEMTDEEWAALTSVPTDEEREDDRRVQEMIDEQRRSSKEQVRRQMGLSQ
jgi:predicted DNA-binding antitoxin AbrB/MazE fold protein